MCGELKNEINVGLVWVDVLCLAQTWGRARFCAVSFAFTLFFSPLYCLIGWVFQAFSVSVLKRNSLTVKYFGGSEIVKGKYKYKPFLVGLLVWLCLIPNFLKQLSKMFSFTNNLYEALALRRLQCLKIYYKIRKCLKCSAGQAAFVEKESELMFLLFARFTAKLATEASEELWWPNVKT